MWVSKEYKLICWCLMMQEQKSISVDLTVAVVSVEIINIKPADPVRISNKPVMAGVHPASW